MTHDDLDGSLEELRDVLLRGHGAASPDAADRVLAGARARLLDEARSAPPRRLLALRWPRLLAAAAVVVVLVAATLVGIGLPRPATAAATETLERAAAAAIGSVDQPVPPGRYRFVGTRAWWLSSHGTSPPLSFLEENRYDVWVPADPDQEWLLVRGPTGRRVWIQGSEAEAEVAGIDFGLSDRAETIRARCGGFYPSDPPDDPCTSAGSWQTPTPAFLAGLPREPRALLDRLRRDAPDNGRGDAELLVYATDALRSGLVPADLRSALYLALSRVDGLTVTDGAVNLDGVVGTGLGIDDGISRQEIVVDPATGTFLGERQVLLDGDDGLPAGTVTTFSSVVTAVVDRAGDRP